MKRVILCAAAAAMSIFAVSAKADSLAAPGFYNGSGGINDGFTVVNSSGIELGLRAQNRFPTPSNPNVITPTGNTYAVAGGFHDATHANWNYDFSINLLSSGNTLSSIIAVLTVTDTSVVGGTPGSNTMLSNYTLFGDDGGYFKDNTNATVITHSSYPTGFGGNLGDQNSENPAFSQFALGSTYFAGHSSDSYNFQLDVFAKNANGGEGALLASDNINVSPVGTPLPATVWQGAVLLGGFGIFSLAKRRKPVAAL